jgi:dihydropyrimidinase
VFDPGKRVTISARTHHSKSDYNLFEGTEVQGAPELVLVRGRPVVDDEKLVAPPGHGSFVRRARFGEQLRAGERVGAG